ncbi:enoyl-CoA hydratase/isomerase family protein [Salipiger sp.]|uniref:enoyl-CoA hydratase/isomerase family protein n=1 Tax=Salipiger sp. TaxID=2078585 RepID=UPI003A96E871
MTGSEADQVDALLFEVGDGIATITLNRPEKRNAFTDGMVRRWVQLLQDAEMRDDVKVVVLTGTGTAFSAGGDIGDFREKAEESPIAVRDRLVTNAQSLAHALTRMEKPVIAAVNGAATGGGMDVALLCDIRLASESARFAETYARLGLVPGLGGAWLLPRLVGTARALDLLWTARWVDAAEAQSIGLVTHVFPDDTFRDKVASFAAQLAAAPPMSLRYIKQLVRQSHDSDFDTHLDAVATKLALVRTSSDHKEAIAARRDKRAPVFKGR